MRTVGRSFDPGDRLSPFFDLSPLLDLPKSTSKKGSRRLIPCVRTVMSPCLGSAWRSDTLILYYIKVGSTWVVINNESKKFFPILDF